MSWLKRLLGGKADEAAAREAATDGSRVTLAAHGRRIVSIPELDMVGERAASANGRYTLVWHDRRWIDGNVTEGRYLLIDGDTVFVDAKMERPQDGKVADAGTFILNDWGDSDALSGTFHAFRNDGSPLLSRRFSANLLNNGLSSDGRLAACQTCNAPGSPDSSILTVFDLAAGAVVAAWTAESGWATGYEFPEGGDRIRMVRGDRPSLDYSLEGAFLHRRLWLQDEVNRGTLYVIRKALAEGEAATGLSVEALRSGVRRALAEGGERFEPEAWRLLGEIEESAGNASAALDAYDRALMANPKIGVAKRAAALRKELAAR
ncbi:MAG: hypothetical protein ACT4N8_03855 [Sphingosinicella sp.]|uniref:hypothetical protein n=1 Tax=Sphingosinicella sp. TaxID=1917971 RepID=UPI004037664F